MRAQPPGGGELARDTITVTGQNDACQQESLWATKLLQKKIKWMISSGSCGYHAGAGTLCGEG